MRQLANGKRSRGRQGRNKASNPRSHTFDSSGPEGKVRGTANQIFEKYLNLARDAQSSGDRVAAENFFQHAEHYFRLMNVNPGYPRHVANGFTGGEDVDITGEAESDFGPANGAHQVSSTSSPTSPAAIAAAAAGNRTAEDQDAAPRERRARRSRSVREDDNAVESPNA